MNRPIPRRPVRGAAAALARCFGLYQRGVQVLNHLQPLAALLARAYVAQVFFLSGLTKLRDWSVTLALFQEEYKVPLLPPELAAVMGTAGELVLPVLLLLGLGGRFAALGLSVVNVMAVLSLAEIAPAALQQHLTWGVLLATLALYGAGKWTLDAWLCQRYVALGRAAGGGHNSPT
jgi:putative oxidoreductase